jgi:DNA-binding beta-propeller fold protein YncE
LGVPVLIALPPHSVPIASRFDYVTVDAQRDRVYAAHTGSQTLLIADGKTGTVLGQVEVGPMHGVAVDPADGTVYTGDGTDQTIDKVDPVALKVVASVSVPGNVDGIEYDPQLHRIYADEDSGSHVYVIDTASMKLIGTIALPSSDPEAMAIDPATHLFYQNLNDRNSIAVIDPKSLKVIKIIKTPQIVNNHPLLFSPQLDQLVVAGKNGVMSAYTPDGRHLGDGKVQPDIDQCSLGQSGDEAVCAGKGVITLVKLVRHGAPTVVATIDTKRAVHTVDVDERTSRVWIVYPSPTGDFIEALRIAPLRKGRAIAREDSRPYARADR